MERCSWLKCLGVILILIGTVMIFTWDTILNHIFSKEFALSPTSQVYSIWEKSQLPIVLDIYLFNCTNAEELSRDFKPNLQEVGPFRFREYQNKVNVTWNDNNTVSYRQKKLFYFDEKESVSAMQEKITTLNLPPIVASYKARNLGSWASFSLSVSIKMLEKSIWVTKPVNELLFDGYPDPLLTLSSIFSGDEKHRVGFFYGKNESFLADGCFNMETGVQDLSRIGILHQWNFANRTYRFDEGCDDVRGYVGHFFPPRMTKEPFYFFSVDVCKSVKCFFGEEVEKFGLKGYKFYPDKKLLDNGHTDPETACNCGGDVCMPPGVINFTRCLQGVPMFASFPHFLDADPVYLDSVTGLFPNASRSNFHIIVEPTLGIPIELAAHVQYNVMLQQNPKISLFEDVPNLVFPLFWVQKRIGINEEMAQKIKFILFLPTLGTSCAIGLMLLGFLIIIVSMLPVICKKMHLSPITKIRKTKTINEVSFSKSDGMTLKKEEEDKENEFTKIMDKLSKEEKMEIIQNCKETDILT